MARKTTVCDGAPQVHLYLDPCQRFRKGVGIVIRLLLPLPCAGYRVTTLCTRAAQPRCTTCLECLAGPPCSLPSARSLGYKPHKSEQGTCTAVQFNGAFPPSGHAAIHSLA